MPPGHFSTEMSVFPEARGSSTWTSSPHYFHPTSWKLRPGARADSKDEVAPDCERASFGLSTEEFFETVPQSYFEGLAPIPVG
jgi:hypothetical protein